MVWRGGNEPIGEYVDESEVQPAGLEINWDTARRGRFSLSYHRHTHCDKWAIRAAIVFLPVRTAWHALGKSRHIAHLAYRRRFCRRRCNQRRSNQPNDHKDREQMTDESAKIHILSSHGTGNL